MSNDKATKMQAKQAVKFPANGHKRAALYARVSTDQQADKGYSLPSQLEGCRAYAAKMGFHVVAEFADDCSGTIAVMDRPQGKELYRLVDSGAVDVAILYTLDRTARDERVLEYLLFKSYLHDHKVELHFSDTGLDSYSMEGNLVGYIKANGASDERKKIAERTSRGRSKKASSGKYVGMGQPPYGYRRMGNRENVQLIIYDPEARIVRDIFNWYIVDGLTGHGIARRLSEAKIPTSGESRGFQRKRESGMWCPETVHDILRNETYAGVWRYGKIERKGNNNKNRDISQTIAVSVPAIVSQDTWDKAQNRRRGNKKTSRRKHAYLMSGRIACGCGKSMAGCGNGGGRKYHYYVCNTLTHRHGGIEDRGCKERSVRAEALDQAAWNFALYAKRSYAEFKAMLEEQQEKQRQGFLPVQQRMGQVQKELAEVTRKIQRIAGLMSDTDLPQEAEAEFKQNLVITSRQKESLTQEQEELASSEEYAQAG